MTTWNCQHSNSCRAYHLLHKKDKIHLDLLSGYKEISEKEKEEEICLDKMDEEINQKLEAIIEKERIGN